MLFGINIKGAILKYCIYIYWYTYLPIKVFLVRRKKIINVAFVLSDLGKWKTESLYNEMLGHCRFNPIIYIIPYVNRDNKGLSILKDYLKKKKYDYYDLDNGKLFSDIIQPDIIFYQEPYNNIIPSQYVYKRNFSSLFCYAAYGFHWINNEWISNQTLKNFCWQVYYENDIVVKGIPSLMTNKGKNSFVTGLPMTDIFLQPGVIKNNPWKKQDSKKFKIIWAPHHTLLEDSRIHNSTFLTYCDYMIDLAEKYKDKIQIAFKPHPVLITRLYQIWGKSKTDEYYAKWNSGDNTQLVLGEYVSLFMNSDAMIHDCGSFMIEYHYTRNPILFLLNEANQNKDINEFGRMAFDLHYKGRCRKDVEDFIENVIDGKDEMKPLREAFYNNHLLPPNGKSASENIIKAILGY